MSSVLKTIGKIAGVVALVTQSPIAIAVSVPSAPGCKLSARKPR